MNDVLGESLAEPPTDFMELTAEIVSAYVSNNALSPTDLSKLMVDVHSALKGLHATGALEPVEELKPAAPIRKSVTPDYIICLDDGKKFKSLKRHLRTHYNLSPEEYRERWGLPADYPMVAPAYSAKRSELAKSNGLGKKVTSEPQPAAAPAARRRTGRAKIGLKL